MAARSALEIRSPHFYARPSQARAVRKRSGFVFPSTDRVTRLVNRYYYQIPTKTPKYRKRSVKYQPILPQFFSRQSGKCLPALQNVENVIIVENLKFYMLG